MFEKHFADGKRSPSIPRDLVRGNILLSCMSQISFNDYFIFFPLMVTRLFKGKSNVQAFWHLLFEIHVSVIFFQLSLVLITMLPKCLKNMSS